MDKEKYILHYRNLKQYLSLGLKLKKVHKVLKFKQSPWVKEYIDINTQFRQEANKKIKLRRWNLHIYCTSHSNKTIFLTIYGQRSILT